MTDSTKTGNSASATGESPAAVQVDVQDPLPETDWLWRRTYTFALSLISLAFIWYGVEALYKLNRPDELYGVTRYMIGILAMLILFYMVAPSAEQIVKIIQSARLLQSGVQINRSASVQTPESKAEVTTQTGPPPSQGSSARRSRYVDEE